VTRVTRPFANLHARWRKVREDLGVPDVTSHSFRKPLATLIDEEGLSARIGAPKGPKRKKL
jgi:hypothetical protein